MEGTLPAQVVAGPVGRGVRFHFQIPEYCRLDPKFADPKSFAMELYTLGDEVDALRASRKTGNLGNELLRRAVVQIDGKPVQNPDWLDKTSPGVRRLMTRALDKLTMFGETDTEVTNVEADFFSTMRTEV